MSVTVYYRRDEIPKVKDWLRNNLDEIKTISFLCQNDHGFAQAPKEKISQEQFEKLSSKVKKIPLDKITEGGIIADTDCEGGQCPIK